MQFQSIKAGTGRALVTVFFVLFLSACGGGSSDSSDSSGSSDGSSSAQSAEQYTNTGIQQAASSGSQQDLIQGSTDSDSNSRSPKTNVDTGSFALEWTAPVSRSDGSPLSLSDINGFKVYYGKSKRKYTHYIDVSNGTAQSVTVKDVPVGNYYVVMTTYDNDGRESGYSSVVTKNVL